ncbi:MAG: SIMPL domain-containing protein, partial [Salinimicrobium sp.]
NRIDGIQFQSSKRETLESQARKKAILDAKQKAEEYAQALGQEIGKAHAINELNSGEFPPMYRAMEMKAADTAEAQTMAPGEIEVTVKVNVGFFLN